MFCNYELIINKLFRFLYTMSRNYLFFDQYQELVRKTDRTPQKGIAGLHFALLGLFGEVGSLLSELKKKQRDKDSYSGYEESVIEEFGDVMWYFTNIADRAGLDINNLAQKISREIDNWDNQDDQNSNTFVEIQLSKKNYGPVSIEKFEQGAIALAGKVGKLLDEFSVGIIKSNRDALSARLVEIFRAIVQAAQDADINLEDVVRQNVIKVTGRYPIERKNERKYTPLFDSAFDSDEQIPRKIKMVIEEKEVNGKLFVIQKCHGIKIGDRLTDNRTEHDDYRFHDVFHLAYAAILGWSPVIRALLKVKRKSDPEIDENQDGARAILIEEGVATWIFNHGFRLKDYESIKSLDYALLKAIKELVKGYEVEKCPLWQWEEAILAGFKAFRYLKKHRKGLVIADLEKRLITVESIN